MAAMFSVQDFDDVLTTIKDVFPKARIGFTLRSGEVNKDLVQRELVLKTDVDAFDTKDLLDEHLKRLVGEGWELSCEAGSSLLRWGKVLSRETVPK